MNRCVYQDERYRGITPTFESLLEDDSKAQPPLCILWYPLHTTSYEDGGRTMQIPLVSKFLCYLEAAARMEMAGISRPHQIPVSNGYWLVSNRYRARFWYPMDTSMEGELVMWESPACARFGYPMDTGASPTYTAPDSGIQWIPARLQWIPVQRRSS